MCVLLDVTPDEALESVRANLFFVGVAHLALLTAVLHASRAGRRHRQGRDPSRIALSRELEQSGRRAQIPPHEPG